MRLALIQRLHAPVTLIVIATPTNGSIGVREENGITFEALVSFTSLRRGLQAKQ